MIDVGFDDRKFDADGDWKLCLHDDRCEQRYRDEDGVMYCETLMRVKGTVNAALSLLRGPWKWWEHGRSLCFHVNDDLSTEQVLAPVSWFWTRVGLRIYLPLDQPETGGKRLVVSMWKHFEGPATFDLYPEPGSAGVIIVRGRFHGVRNHVPLVPLELAAKAHLRAEAGNFLLPFPQGTGWCGLYRRLDWLSRTPNGQDAVSHGEACWRCFAERRNPPACATWLHAVDNGVVEGRPSVEPRCLVGERAPCDAAAPREQRLPSRQGPPRLSQPNGSVPTATYAP